MQTLRNALIVPTLLLSLCAFAEGATREETREVSDFDGVEVSHGLQAKVTVGAKAVRVSGDEKQLSRLRTEVVDGKLVVRMEKNSWHDSTRGVRVTISTPKLTSVEGSGGAEVDAEATPAESFSVEASGGADVTVRNVDAKRLKVDSSGGAEVTLKGRAEKAEVDASGGAEVHAKELALQSLDVDASGGADVEASPSERITGEASSGSSVHVNGSPSQREISTSSGADVSYRKR